jgi:hypothetical protein
MVSTRRRLKLVTLAFALLVVLLLAGSVSGQGLMRGSGLDLAPTNPFGMPGTTGGLPQGSNSLYLNSGMFKDILPRISNLEIGYLYQFGNVISTGRLTFDYVLPAYPSYDSAAFGEAHAEFTNFGKTLQRIFSSGNTTTTERGYPDRIDLSFGGGYRKIFGDNLLLGVNAFGDTTKLADQWYGSGGVGFEMAALGAGNDLVELNFNFYGNLFQGRNSIVNAFRNGPRNYDASVAYSLQLGADGPDLRLKLTGYRFDIGTSQYGGNADAELKSKNGVFSLRGGVGHDPVNGWYHTVGGFVNVGVQFSRIFSGESPFTAPEPIFKSPRNLRRLLSRKVDRNYISPPATVTRVGIAAPGGVACTNNCPDPTSGLIVATWAIPLSATLSAPTACQPLPPSGATSDEGIYDYYFSRQGASGVLSIQLASDPGCTDYYVIGIIADDAECVLHSGDSLPPGLLHYFRAGPGISGTTVSAGCIVITVVQTSGGG